MMAWRRQQQRYQGIISSDTNSWNLWSEVPRKRTTTTTTTATATITTTILAAKVNFETPRNILLDIKHDHTYVNKDSF